MAFAFVRPGQSAAQFASMLRPQLVGSIWVGQTITVLSSIIDAFAAPGTLTPIIPALGSGYRFVAVANPRWLVVSLAGTVTGTHSGKAGTNGAHDNFSPSITMSANAAQITAAAAGDYTTGVINALTGKAAILGSPENISDVVYEQVTAATGAGASLTLRLQISGVVAMFP
jgi:hypothetical protein